MALFSKEQIDAFWSKVDITTSSQDCWEWLGAKKPTGYGNLSINKSYMSAHRFAFELENKFEIPEGMIICHTCDNPSCCNPAHLMLGSKKANTFDMIRKQRAGFKKNRAIGTRNANAKLDDRKISSIRRQYNNHEKTQKQLAELFGVSQTCIGSIVRNQTWRHVNG